MDYLPASVTSKPSLAPVMHLLQDLDKYSRQLGLHHEHARHRDGVHHVFMPNFDMRERQDSFELLGELAGARKDDVTIEFTEPQTLVVRGRVAREYEHDLPCEAGPAHENAPSPAEPPTMDGGRSVGGGAPEGRSPPPGLAPGTGPSAETEPANANGHGHAKYCISERNVGEFSRTFAFPERVEREAVTARLEGGILRIVVPKTKPHPTRRHRVAIV
ncbi:hypothetical protein RJ55_04299 [Drechmeria coniospora]|nr:hypothetical protein RJ55_04299 [Drechmeria coniospora]